MTAQTELRDQYWHGTGSDVVLPVGHSAYCARVLGARSRPQRGVVPERPEEGTEAACSGRAHLGGNKLTVNSRQLWGAAHLITWGEMVLVVRVASGWRRACSNLCLAELTCGPKAFASVGGTAAR